MGWFIRTFYTLAAAGAIYVAAICTLTIPRVQRKATYAHDINPAILLRQNLSDVEQFGFLHHQVQPFTFETDDGETLFAWHILPAHLYRQHEAALKAQPNFGRKPFEQAAMDVGLKLLLDDPAARVVVSFHGNAAHVGSSYRPATYQQFLATSTVERPVHVIAFDYRGFGLSTGTPNEEGVVQDGISLLSRLTGTNELAMSAEQTGVQVPYADANVDNNSSTTKSSLSPRSRSDGRLSPAQIILAGQSMGTFVSTAVYHRWTLDLHQPAPKGLLLFASFSSLPKLLDSYSFKGLTPPLLSPLAGYPWIQRWFMSRIVDHWDTASRLRELVNSSSSRYIPLDLTIMHARDDWEISWREGKRNWEAVLEAAGSIEGVDGNVVDDEDASNAGVVIEMDPADPSVEVGLWTDGKGKRVKWEKVRRGGHNKIPVSEHAKVALMELLER